MRYFRELLTLSAFIAAVASLRADNITIQSTDYPSGQAPVAIGNYDAILTSGAVTVESGANVTFESTASQVDLKPGFHAIQGGAFHARAGTDTIPPTAPTDISVLSGTQGAITLGWSTTDAIGVTGSQVKVNGSIVSGSFTGTAGTFSTTMANGTALSVSVQARDAAGNWSAWSTPTTIKVLQQVSYGYDGATGRLKSVSSNGQTFDYGYHAGSDLVETVTQRNGSFQRHTYWESDRDVPDTVTTTWGGTTKASFTYGYDWNPRQVSEAITGELLSSIQGSTGVAVMRRYSYTTRSEHDVVTENNLTSTSALGNPSQNIGAPIDGPYRDWSYDQSGNRTTEARTGSWSTTYSANALNQYTSLSGSISKPSITYDDDGNVIADGAWNYIWDAENRLAQMARTDASQLITFKYDYQNRRVEKSVTTGSTTKTTRYIWEGDNLAAEYDASTPDTMTNAYAWGLDLSGTIDGAGGVGGLLMVTTTGTSGSTNYFPVYDSTGNVRAYFNSGNGFAAVFEYGTYGEMLAPANDVGGFFIRFASKYYDEETKLYQYNERYYNPTLGRFINRDPIEEDGGLNLYAYCGNDGVNNYDLLGLEQIVHANWTLYDGNGHAIGSYVATAWLSDANDPLGGGRLLRQDPGLTDQWTVTGVGVKFTQTSPGSVIFWDSFGPHGPLFPAGSGPQPTPTPAPTPAPSPTPTAPSLVYSFGANSWNTAPNNRTDADRYGEIRAVSDPGFWNWDGAVANLRGFRDRGLGLVSMLAHPIDAYESFNTVREPLTPYGSKIDNFLISAEMQLSSPYGRGGFLFDFAAAKGLGRIQAVAGDSVSAFRAGLADSVPDGSFSITARGWQGYPSNPNVPKPEGPFRLLQGAEKDTARNAANNANRAAHRADPSLAGKQIHEIQPVKFGGSPTDPANKVPLTPQEHAPFTTWWRQLQNDLER